MDMEKPEFNLSQIKVLLEMLNSGIQHLDWTFLLLMMMGDQTMRNIFKTELTSLIAEYGIITNDFIPANADSFKIPYNIIIWNTGVTEPGISSVEMNVIKNFS
ncbi:MAG: hypothetical protein MZV64_26245 [Ignavibacteriales bacterium]|nr:hypothetical protein [Ignavibacteriales bacterium]